MTIRSGDPSRIRLEMSGEPAQKTSRTEERSSEVAARELHHYNIQGGPLPASRRENASQESSLTRSINGSYRLLHQNLKDQARPEDEKRSQWEEFLDKRKNLRLDIEAVKSLQQKVKQNEQKKSQGLHQVRDAPVHKVANSAKNDRYQSDTCDNKGDGHKEPANELKDQAKETVAGPPLSESRSGHHPEQQLKLTIPDVPSRGDKQITQMGNTLCENIREGQTIGSKQAPPLTKSFFSDFADRLRSKANLGRVEKNNAREGPSAYSALMIDHLCNILGQLPDTWPSVIDERSERIVGMMLNYAVTWLQLLLMLPHCTQPILACVIAITYIATDLSILYQHIGNFWYVEDPKLYIDALVLRNIVRCHSLNLMICGLGPACATTLVRFIPELTNVMQRMSWFWRCTGTKEEPMAQIPFQRYCRPDIAYIQGPFPKYSNKNCQSSILDSFDVKSRSWFYAVAWDMLLEIVQYASFYVALFSGDSWLSKIMALVFAYFAGSKYCPRPRTVDHARSVHDLIVRAYNDTIDSGTTQRPSFSECLDHQPIVTHYLQVFAIKMVEALEGRPIDNGGFDSLGAPAMSLFLFLVFFVPVAIILTLGWHWFGPTVTVTFS